MADRDQERHYKPAGLNRWFAVSAILLLAAVVGAFLQDYNREWKRYQREFRDIDRQITRGAYETELARLDGEAQYRQAVAAAADARDRQGELRNEIRAAEREVRRAETDFQAVDQRFLTDKARYEEALYRFEQAQAGERGDPDRERSRKERLFAQYQEVSVEHEQASLSLEDVEAQLAGYREALRQAERAVTALERDADLLLGKLERIDPSAMDFWNRLGTAVRNLPIVDLAQPSLKIEQVVLSDIREDLNFEMVPRVDRCVTCHQGVLRSDLADAPNPHRTHPQLDLFLASDSPHPLEEFGCTSCHGGRGRATDFYGTVHTPDGDEQRATWVSDRGWREFHLWEEPMHPVRYAEAGCFQCHAGQTTVKGAEKLNFGLSLIERAGCYGCHEIDSYEDLGARGPSLARVKDKLTPDWAFRWIEDPQSFRAAAWMPAFFGQSNNSTPELLARSSQEIHAMVTYLWDRADGYRMMPVPAGGDAARGEELVASVGCMACHQLPDDQEPAADRDALRRQFGPNFSGIGSKTTARWIYNWLRDPESYHAETRMPNMRLTEQEAADVTAYLITFRDDPYDPPPPVDEELVGAIVFDFLAKTAPPSVARERAAAMDLNAKLNYAGERLIRQYGCFGCHEIPGFEDAKPIGTELTAIGHKPLHQFDFGFLHIEHSRYAWWTRKMSDPRSFDEHKELAPDALLRMPNFGFTDLQVEAVVTALAGFTDADAELTRIVPRTPENLAVERGQQLVRTNNCQGCHVIEGEGGSVAPTVTDWLQRFRGQGAAAAEAATAGFVPPNLIGEGAKVKTDWLFEFLHRPSEIRPWLAARMPTFGFTAGEINDLARYFSALDGQEFPFVDQVEPALTEEELAAAETLFSPDFFNCTTCHIEAGRTPAGSPDRWAPDFALAAERLKPQWIIDWIADPQALLPGTRMPTFYPQATPRQILDGDADHQIRVLRDYLLMIGRDAAGR